MASGLGVVKQRRRRVMSVTKLAAVKGARAREFGIVVGESGAKVGISRRWNVFSSECMPPSSSSSTATSTFILYHIFYLLAFSYVR